MKRTRLLPTVMFFLAIACVGVGYKLIQKYFVQTEQIFTGYSFQACKKHTYEESYEELYINNSDLKTIEIREKIEESEHRRPKDEYFTDLILKLITELPNNLKRRELLQNIQQLDDTQQERIVYFLSGSERELDQESAVSLAIELKSESVRLRVIRELLESNISDNVKLILSNELNTTLPNYLFDLAVSTYYQTQSVKIRTALIDSILSSPDFRSRSLEEVLLTVRSAPSTSIAQQLKPLLEWLKFGHETLSESQKRTIVFFSDDLFFETNNLKQKEIALLIRQLVSPEE